MEKTTHSGQTKGIRVGGIITEIEKNSFTFDFRIRNRETKKVVEKMQPRTQKILDKKDNYFQLPTVSRQRVHLVYLTENSLEGKYENPEFNLPYQIFTENGYELYRQSTVDKKQDILNKLEKATLKKN